MNLRAPLYAKILGWFFLNLVLLGTGFYLLAIFQFHLSLDSLLAGRAGERVEVLAKVIEGELQTRQPSEWRSLLERLGDSYGVKFYLVAENGAQLDGEPISLPREVAEKLPGLPGRPRLIRPPAPGDRQVEPGLDEDSPPPRRGSAAGQREPPNRPKFMLLAGNPAKYWVGVRMRVRTYGVHPARPAVLLAASDSINGGGLFFDSTPWMAAGFGAVLLSLLFWIPFVHSITRDLGQLTRATERIADGKFDVDVSLHRGDELGRLGSAVAQLSERLAGFVTGQKRFLGDIAHELCSPLARMEMALGILDQRADEPQKEYIGDVREEVRHMSGLVNELLLFSKAGLGGLEPSLTRVDLNTVVQDAIQREGQEGTEIRREIPEGLFALGEPALLSRAIANLIRNSLRYAGGAGPIIIHADANGGHITLTVADHGPGVPEEALVKLGEPFFRPDTARARETGGTGLGLAIVRSCVNACQGTVAFRNRREGGLEARVTLRKSP
ncbi:MAG TPA: HAMP domain-containing sensor histidine kinase [Candidatus Limnocylindria bacterium]|nr:HAMP domain-containing sensor histidine kinase [Candidatus Limnocylindria bacterium]